MLQATVTSRHTVTSTSRTHSWAFKQSSSCSNSACKHVLLPYGDGQYLGTAAREAIKERSR